MSLNDHSPIPVAGLDNVGETLFHERHHVLQFYAGFPDAEGDGIPDYEPTLDRDGDGLSNFYENQFSDLSPYTNWTGYPNTIYPDIEKHTKGGAQLLWQHNQFNHLEWAAPGKNYNFWEEL